MLIRPHHRQLASGLTLGLLALAIGLAIGLAILLQRDPGPVCAKVTPEAAVPGLATLDGPLPPRPACIRVELATTG